MNTAATANSNKLLLFSCTLSNNPIDIFIEQFFAMLCATPNEQILNDLLN